MATVFIDYFDSTGALYGVEKRDLKPKYGGKLVKDEFRHLSLLPPQLMELFVFGLKSESVSPDSQPRVIEI